MNNTLSNNQATAFYHYTSRPETIKAILTSKVLRKEHRWYVGQVCSVWFSTNPVWENTAAKIPYEMPHGVEEHANAKGLGAYRIRINDQAVKLINWAKYKKSSGEDAKMCMGLEKVAAKIGANPQEWFCHYKDIPLNDQTVISVGYYHDGYWDDMPMNVFLEKFIDTEKSAEMPGNENLENFSLADVISGLNSGMKLSKRAMKKLQKIVNGPGGASVELCISNGVIDIAK